MTGELAGFNIDMARSLAETIAVKLELKSPRMPVENVDKGTNMVAKGDANAILADFPICLSVMKRYPDSGFQSAASLLTYEPIGMAQPANDPLLMNLTGNFINHAEKFMNWLKNGLGRPD